MTQKEYTIGVLKRAFPNLGDVVDMVRADLGGVEKVMKSPSELVHWNTLRSPGMPLSEKKAFDDVRSLIAPVGEVIEKIEAGEDLSRDEWMVAEAVVALYGRPALLVQDDDFGTPPGNWAMLAFKREEIKAVLPSVGRIEYTLPGLDHIGTGFLVGQELIITNRHVAKNFARFKDGRWEFVPFISVQIDYKEEQDRPDAREFRIREVLGVHENYDLALLRIESVGKGGAKPPSPLPVMGREPDTIDGAYVYVVGYPAKDVSRNDPEQLSRIFANIYNCKRLQPGNLLSLGPAEHEGAPDGPVLHHDCSTLGGNSGSCLIDLASGMVWGLHYGGYYGKENYAVPLWQLADDPFLRRHGVQFKG